MRARKLHCAWPPGSRGQDRPATKSEDVGPVEGHALGAQPLGAGRPHLDTAQVELEGGLMRAQVAAVTLYLESGDPNDRAAAELAVEQLRLAISRRPEHHIARMEMCRDARIEAGQ